MAQIDPNNEAMKQQALKEALTEILHVVSAEVMENFALAEAIREGRKAERVERNEIFNVLEVRL